MRITSLLVAAAVATLAGSLSAQCGSANLGTLFAANNGGSAGWGVFVDLQVTNPLGVVVCAIDTNCGTTAVNTAYTVDVWVTPGSYQSVHGVPSAWRRVATGSGVAAGNNIASLTTMQQPFYLPAGNYGIAFYHNGTSVRYTNGTGSNEFYSNADLALTAGLVRSTFFGTPTAGSIFTPRVWNGTIYYDVPSPTSLAGSGFYAAGCAGTAGISNLAVTAVPRLGQAMSVDVNNLPVNIAIMLTGLSKTMSGFGPLPLNLAPFGAPTCAANASADASAFLVGTIGTATFNFFIPNRPALQGVVFYNQALSLDPTFNSLGAVTSDAIGSAIGL